MALFFAYFIGRHAKAAFSRSGFCVQLSADKCLSREIG